MTAFYIPVLIAHVLVAVLGLGSILAIAVVAATARRVGPGSTGAAMGVAPLLRVSTFGLLSMLVTGVLLDFAAGGAFHARWWFRGSGLLLIATGILNGLARRTVRPMLTNANAGDGSKDAALRRVQQITYGMCVLIAAITVLMVVKPF
jgi:hypothetical protein